jgi:hypothetical protein
MVALMITGALLGSALSSIVLGALYYYATENRLPEVFSGAPLQSAFRAR